MAEWGHQGLFRETARDPEASGRGVKVGSAVMFTSSHLQRNRVKECVFGVPSKRGLSVRNVARAQSTRCILGWDRN